MPTTVTFICVAVFEIDVFSVAIGAGNWSLRQSSGSMYTGVSVPLELVAGEPSRFSQPTFGVRDSGVVSDAGSVMAYANAAVG